MQSKHDSTLVLRNGFVLLQSTSIAREGWDGTNCRIERRCDQSFPSNLRSSSADLQSPHHKFSLKEAQNQSRLLFLPFLSSREEGGGGGGAAPPACFFWGPPPPPPRAFRLVSVNSQLMDKRSYRKRGFHQRLRLQGSPQRIMTVSITVIISKSFYTIP